MKVLSVVFTNTVNIPKIGTLEINTVIVLKFEIGSFKNPFCLLSLACDLNCPVYLFS